MIIKLGRFLLRSAFLREYAKRAYEELKGTIATNGLSDPSVPEAMPVSSRVSVHSGIRFNLLIPALSTRHVFGGIATAVDIFQSLTANMTNVRILLTDESVFEHSDNPAFAEWTIGRLADVDFGGRVIIPMGNRYGETLPVAEGDRFIASAWWTAVIVQRIREWQTATYCLPSAHRFLYLIQDYEPGFYPWSSRYALAESTYSESEGMIALFNTSILQRFFADQGYQFQHQFAFEPRVNRHLAAYLDQVDLLKKEKRILIYGRPGVARNAFELLIMGLREWLVRCPAAKNWTIISVGEPHDNITLGDGIQIHSKGKLSLESYAQELLRCSIGLSLMISPHPSYPPLEMAAFGLKVLTNGYGVKDLSKVHENIISLDPLSPRTIADALIKVTSVEGVSLPIQAKASEFWTQYADGAGGGHNELIDPIIRLLSSH